MTPLTRWTFLPIISLFSFSPLSAFLLGSDTVYRRQCPFEWQGERKKQILLKCRPKRFFLRPCDRPKNEPVIFNGETNKIQNRRRLFFFLRFFKRVGDIQCVKVLLRCFVYYLFVCLRTPLGGEDQSTRIKKQTLLMNGRCGLLSYGSRGDDAVFQEHLNLIQTVFQNRKS